MKIKKMSMVCFLCILCFLPQQASWPKTCWSYPLVSKIEGIVVGLTSVSSIQSRFGHGNELMGVHPNSNHHWRIRNSNGWLIINADGSNYGPQGLIVDQITVSGDFARKYSGRADKPKLTVGFVGNISLGMSKREVLRSVVKRIERPICNNDKYTWQSTKLDGTKKRTWIATLHFENDSLDWIEIDSDIENL